MSNVLDDFKSNTLWAGWSIGLPHSNCTRNDDGSWSAWGADWTIDVNIIEFSPPNVIPTDAVQRSVAAGGEQLSGNGWAGAAESLVELDGDREVYRLAGTLAAPGTLMSCWVSYFRQEQHTFAHRLVSSIAHSVTT